MRKLNLKFKTNGRWRVEGFCCCCCSNSLVLNSRGSWVKLPEVTRWCWRRKNNRSLDWGVVLTFNCLHKRHNLPENRFYVSVRTLSGSSGVQRRRTPTWAFCHVSWSSSTGGVWWSCRLICEPSLSFSSSYISFFSAHFQDQEFLYSCYFEPIFSSFFFAGLYLY